MDFSLIKQAGIKQGEFAAMAGVTRTTVNLWVNGKMNPSRYVREDVAAVMATLRAALDAGDLPLPDNLKPSEREDALRAIEDTYAAHAD